MTRQSGNLSAVERAFSALLGVSFSLLALQRGNGLVRGLNALAGAALLSRSYAGHCAMKAAVRGESSLKEGISDQWERMRIAPSTSNRGKNSRPLESTASVDTGVEDSFPASDPPASHLPDVPPSNAEAKWRAAESPL